MLNLNQLRTFLAVAASGSVREAAEALVVTQPAVSAALGALQRDLGVRLVERNGRGLRITPAGSQLEDYGRQIVALIEEAERATRDAAHGKQHVRIAAVTSGAEQLVPQLLGEFREREPGIEVELQVANRSRIWDILAHWGADVVLAGRPPVGLAATTVATRPNALVVVGRSEAGEANDRLAETTWLMREAGSGTRAATEELFALLGIAPPQITVGSNGAIRECVRAGLGIALLPREAVERDLAEGAIRIVPTPETPLQRDWHLVTSTERPPTSAALRFIEHAVRLGLFERV